MFARKDLEHDVLSAYQRYSRNLKKMSSDSTGSSRYQRLRSNSPVAGDAHSSAEKVSTSARGMLTLLNSYQSQASDVDNPHTYSKMDGPTKETKSGDTDEQEQAEKLEGPEAGKQEGQ